MSRTASNSHSFSHLVELLQSRAQGAPDATAYTFLDKGEKEGGRFTYSQLDEQARSIAVTLQRTMKPGERALLLYPPGLDFIAAFFGCLYSGVVAVPAYPPDPHRLERSLPRLQTIAQDAQTSAILTTRPILTMMKFLMQQGKIAGMLEKIPLLQGLGKKLGEKISRSHLYDFHSLPWIATNKLNAKQALSWKSPSISPEDLAFLQYTSGSTGDPKGVMLSHKNLLYNEKMIEKAFGHNEKTIVVGWLPLYHDMGLIGNVLQPLYLQRPCILMSPLDFLEKPLRWLQAISHYQATTSGGPNFAYDLCVRKVTPEDKANLDLSSWQVAFNGAEPVREETLERFTEAFSGCGFSRRAFYPCYGLAEASLIVSGGEKEEDVVSLSVEEVSLQEGKAVLGEKNTEKVRTLIGAGKSLLEQELLIVDPKKGTPLAPLEIGEIWVSGQHVASGYWKKEEMSVSSFQAQVPGKEKSFLKTGDLGFLHQGELYVTGRQKDLIIVRGRNFYPQDIELTVERSHPALRPGCTAAFSVEKDSEEQLVVIQEVRREFAQDFSPLIETIRQAVAEEQQLQLYAVVLIRAGTISKTSSGKIQRHACKKAFLDETLSVLASNLWENTTLLEEQDRISEEIFSTSDSFEKSEENVVMGIWRSLLQRPKIERDESFFLCGGDSLLATQLLSRLQQEFDVSISLSDLFRHSTIAEQSQLIEKRKYSLHSPLEKIPQEKEGILSLSQQRLWFLTELSVDSSQYNVPGAIRLRGDCDDKLLEKAWNFLRKRHESLRTVFSKPDSEASDNKQEQETDELKALILSPEPMILNMIGFGQEKEPLVEAQKWIEKEISRPFDFKSQESLARLTLLQLGSADHVLFLNLHHIITDGWSLGILTQELSQVYQAYQAGVTPSLPPLAYRYQDFAYWQRFHLAEKVFPSQLNYWEKQLKNSPKLSTVPTDYPRPLEEEHRGRQEKIILPLPLQEKLKEFSQKEGVTLFMVLVSVLKIILFRLTGQEDINLGTAIANRNREELENIVGFFVNTLVLRSYLSHGDTFDDLLSRVKETTLEAYENQDVPFEKVVERVSPPRNLSHAPLFQVMIVQQNIPLPQMDLGATQVEPFPFEEQTSKFDLSFYWWETAEGLECTLEYSTSLYRKESAKRLLQQFQSVLEQVVLDPSRECREYSLKTEEDKALLPQPELPIPEPEYPSVMEQFARWVGETPLNTALSQGDFSLNYQDLAVKISSMAQYLREEGVKQGDVVAVFASRSVGLVVGMLATFQAKGVFLAIDQKIPSQRQQTMLKEAKVSFILYEGELREEDRWLEELGLKRWHVSSQGDVFSSGADSPEINQKENFSSFSAETLLGNESAYIFFTSGTTGVPKGILGWHKGLAHFITWQREAFTITSEDRGALLSGITFDMVLTDVFLPLTSGATLCLQPESEQSSDANTLLWLEKQKITFLHSVPSVVQNWLRYRSEQVNITNLRWLFLTGEPLTYSLVTNWRDAFPQSGEVINFYGATETTLIQFSQSVPYPPCPGVQLVGEALPHTQAFILSEARQICALGEVGEIVIRTPFRTVGYINESSEQSNFVVNPWRKDPQDLLYFTGDKGRFHQDGSLEVLGRIDHQIKIHGARVELREIESWLEKFPSIAKAVVIFSPEEQILLAYLIVRETKSVSKQKLRNFLAHSLPLYMVPSIFTMIPQFPLAPSGKVDREALLQMPRPGGEESYVPPRNEKESQLVAIWEELLQKDKLGIEDNFFEAGGHSLLATQLVSRLQKKFAVSISLSDLFRHSTIAEQSLLIEKLTHSSYSSLSRVSSEKEGILSLSQERLWFLMELAPESPQYNVPGAIHLKGVCHYKLLEKAWGFLEQRHESLRTVFYREERESREVKAKILPRRETSLEIVPLDQTKDPQTQARKWIEREISKPFRLEKNKPLTRLTLLRLAEEEHVLFLNLHHIIADGWSLGVLTQEFSFVYQAYQAQEVPLLPSLAYRYQDFAYWQRFQLAEKIFPQQLDYWEKQLRNSAKISTIPTDYPRPKEAGYQGSQEKIVLSASVLEKLKELSKKEGVTLFMTLMSAFQIILARLSGQEDINLGTAIANRNREETESMVGFFVNTLVLRSFVSEEDTFLGLLQKVRKTTLEAYENQDVPFEKVVERVSPPRDLSHAPLFQVMAVYQNIQLPQVNLGSTQVEPFPFTGQTSKFDLSFYWWEVSQGLECVLEYSTALYKPSSIARLLEQFQSVLEQVITNPSRLLNEYSLKTTFDETLLPDPKLTLGEENYPLVLDTFEEWVQKAPGSVALSQGGLILSYKELFEKASKLAFFLEKEGIEKGDVIALSASRSMGLVVGVLSTLKTVGILLTIDRKIPPQRQRIMLEEAQASYILYEGDLKEEDLWMEQSGLKMGLISWQGDLLSKNTDDSALEQDEKEKTSSENSKTATITGDDPAYIFFTSGTTGVPKGILGWHKGLAHFMAWQRETFAIRPDDRGALLTGISFDMVLRDIFLPLTSGATLYLQPEDEQRGDSQTLKWLEREKITFVHLVPSVAQNWLRYRPDDITMQNLRWLFLAGEPLAHSFVESWRNTFSTSGEIVNFYGATETTLIKFFYRVPSPSLSGIQPAGFPLPQTQALVLSKGKQICAIGEVGEIVIRTPYRTMGYINDPLGQSRFVINPWTNDTKDLLYYTGDRGRYQADGGLEVLGRVDHQIKIHGARVELSEIELCLESFPSISKAVVLFSPEEQILLAYFVGKEVEAEEEVKLGEEVEVGEGVSESAKISLPKLRNFLGQSLPLYMIPSLFTELREFPLTPSGKVDRQALLIMKRSNKEDSYLAPRNETESWLASLWQEILGKDKLGIEDNFFEAGGHSLLATQLISRIREHFQVEVRLKDFFTYPTIAGLAEHIALSRKTVAPKIKPRPQEELCPLSFAQERLWFLDQLDSGNIAYNITHALLWEGSLEVDKVEKAFQYIIKRHESLRTNFTMDSNSGQARQYIQKERSWSLSVEDLSHLPWDKANEEAEKICQREAQKTFSLEKDCLLRISLIRLSSESAVLFLNIHHIIADLWSLGILLNEFTKVYCSLTSEQKLELESLNIQYADFAHWQKNWLQGEVLEEQLNYWRKNLDQAATGLNLPADYPRPADQTFRGDRCYLEMDQDLLSSLYYLSETQGVTLFMTLLAAFETLLYRYSGQKDFNVGSAIANRNRREIENLIGFFVNTLVLRARVSPEQSFVDLLQKVKINTLSAYDHQDLPFEKVVDVLRPERNLSQTPFFQVMFVLQNTPLGNSSLPGVEISHFDFAQTIAKFDLTVSLTENEGKISGYWEFNTDLFKLRTIERMRDHFLALLRSILDNPQKQIGRLDFLNAEEKTFLVDTCNQTKAPYSSTRLIHELFEEQVKIGPERIAVIQDHNYLSYEKLNTQANQIARYLKSLGVENGDFVGIYVERNLDSIAGLMGVLKAGGTYVPLETNFPKARLQWILNNLKVRFLITESDLLEKISSLRHDLDFLGEIICLDEESRFIRSKLITDFSGRATVSSREDWEAMGEDNLVFSISVDHLAYVIFTSGSTGTPKGVMVRHQPVVNLIEWVNQTFSIGSEDRVLFITSFCFDLSVYDIFGLLAAGGSLRIASRQDIQDPEKLLSILDDESITFWDSAPAALQQLTTFLHESRSANHPLRLVFLSGDWIPITLPDKIRANFPQAQVISLGGATEATIWSNFYPIGKVKPHWSSIPYGKPIQNARYYILDTYLNPCPIGVAGDLYIGGDCLADGYIQDPAQTGEKFIADPFSHEEGKKIYKTGDRARLWSDGNMEFLGRKDNQVKVRGFRIELGEIEAVLFQHPKIRDAVVVAREEKQSREKRLIAYFVPTEMPVESAKSKFPEVAEISLSDLRTFLRERLPEYMTPSAFIKIKEIPLTPSGKVATKALPEPESKMLSEKQFISPRSKTELILAEIWQDVLKVPQVGIMDNFFELGGDSILSIQIVSRAKAQGISLAPRDIFRHQTIAEMAQVAKKAEREVEEQRSISGRVPLTPIQHWFFSQSLPDPDHWNQGLLLDVKKIELSHLKEIMRQVVEHHDMLRTRYWQEKGTWFQEILPQVSPPPLTHSRLENLEEEAIQEQVDKIATQVQKSLRIGEGKLFAAHYFSLSSEEGLLLLVIHHLVIDGVSWRILLEDLSLGYRELYARQKVELPSKTTSFLAWAEEMQKQSQDQKSWQKEIDFWLKASHRKPWGLIPLDFLQGQNRESSQRSVVWKAKKDLTEALLKRTVSVYHTQVPDLLLTALLFALDEWKGEDSNWLIDLESHGREEFNADMDLSRSLGWFTSLYPVLLSKKDLSAKDIGRVIKEVKECLHRVPDQGISYGLWRYMGNSSSVREELSLQRAELVFNYLGQYQLTGDSFYEGLSDLSIGSFHSLQGRRPHRLAIQAKVVEEKLQLDFQYSANLHRESSIENLAHLYEKSLIQIISHCQEDGAGGYTPSDFSLASLNQDQLSDLEMHYPHLEDIYPLSPMQKGMLFHSLASPESGVYFEHIRFRVDNLQSEAFYKAWSKLVEQETVLRTAFIWENLSEPLQLVQKQAEIPFFELDWSHLSPEEQENALANLCQEEEEKGFDLEKAPLMRFFVISLGKEEYQVIWNSHHLILDGWSLPIIVQRVFFLYDLFAKGQDCAFLASRRYRDYIAWLQEQDYEQVDRYWKEYLAGISEPTQLGVEKPSKEEDPSSYESHWVEWEISELDHLNDIAHHNKLTLNTLIQGAWALVLHRYSQDKDVLFGITVSGRSIDLPDIENTIGLFINTLPLRVKVDSEQTTLEFLNRIQWDNAEHQDYAHSSLVEIKKQCDIPKDQELFSSIMVFENYPIVDNVSEETIIRVRDLEVVEKTNYPLTLLVHPVGEMRLALLYDTKLYHSEMIQQLLRHLEQALREVCYKMDKPLSEIDILSKEEREKILYSWNQTKREVKDFCLHEPFEKQVKLLPHALAVRDFSRSLTYFELNQEANQLAHKLYSLGAEKKLVAVLLSRSAYLVSGLLGISKAAAAYVPMEPHFPLARIEYILRSLEIEYLLTENGQLEKLSGLLPTLDKLRHVVCWDSEEVSETQEFTDEILVHQEGKQVNIALSDLDLKISPNELAYIIFTSGSTGNPKGVMIRHQPAANLIDWVNQSFSVNEKDQVLFITSVCFDLSVYDVFGILATGASIRVATAEDVLDPSHLFSILCEEPITFWDSAPAALQQVSSFFDSDLAQKSSLRLVFLSGDWIPLSLPLKIQSTFLQSQVISLGGATEATIWSNFYPIEEVDPSWTSIPYGRPIQNARYHILGTDLHPSPVGVSGDLYIGGECLASGYINAPELSSEKFLPDPFSSEKGKRLYRTGDRARYWSDGTMEFLGRLDDQVKVRGFRIELGEIESVLSQHEHVSELVVIAQEKNRHDKRLVAYIVSTPGEQVTSEELRSYLKERLPEYMVPAFYVFLEQIPITANGKVDRKRLPEPSEGILSVGAKVAPEGEKETALWEIWKNVLGFENIGVQDNFFELGGDSILSIQIVSQAKQRGIQLSVQDVFLHSTIAQLALNSSTKEKKKEEDFEREISPDEKKTFLLTLKEEEREALASLLECAENIYPLTPMQQGMLFHTLLEPDAGIYFEHVRFKMKGLKAKLFFRAWEEVMKAETILRTFFVWREVSPPLQIVQKEVPFPGKELDWSSFSGAEQEEKLKLLCLEEEKKGFALDKAPLVRLWLIRFSSEEYQVVWNTHHLLVDGWSMPLILEKVLFCYQDLLKTGQCHLESPHQYHSYVSWLEKQEQKQEQENMAAYWRKYLHSFEEPTRLGIEKSQIKKSSEDLYLRSSLTLPREMVSSLSRTSKNCQVTLNTCFQGAWAILLSRYSQQNEVVFGVTVSGRSADLNGIDKMIGLFINTLPLKVDVAGPMKLHSFLQTIQKENLEHRFYEHSSLAEIKKMSSLEPEQDLFASILVYENYPISAGVGKKLGTEIYDINIVTKTNFPLTVLVVPGESIDIHIIYDQRIFLASDIDDLLIHFQQVIESMIGLEDHSLAKLSLLTQKEEQRIVHAWNQTEKTFPEVSLADLFEKQVDKTPTAIALDDGFNIFSYEELNETSNKIAHILQEKGVERNVFVGIWLNRSSDLVSSLLGIVKSSGAYVPLETNYPIARVKWILESLQVGYLVTNSEQWEQLASEIDELFSSHLCVFLVDYPEKELSSLEAEVITPEKWQNLSHLNPLRVQDPADLAYVIFTSGSTGTPKGVVVQHRPVANLINWVNQEFKVGPGDTLLFLTSICFDLSVYDVFGTLGAGATLRLASREELQDPEKLLQILCQENITFWDSAPAALLQLVPFLDQLEKNEDRSFLRLVFLSGDWIPTSLPSQIQKAFSEAKVISLGGATEATIWSNFYAVDNIPADWKSIPYGKPIDNARYHILDQHLHPCPLGVAGDLYIGGECLALGYHDAVLTSEKFIPDPFSSQEGKRLYRTGDRARYWRDGNIEFLGRLDDQVKVRGFRIELGEIESALKQHPMVSEAIVIAQEFNEQNNVREKRLLAYLLTAPKNSPEIYSKISSEEQDFRKNPSTFGREFLKTRLPEYMIPSYFLVIDTIPLTPNGKLDRKRLPTPQEGERIRTKDYVPARDDQETKLTRIWEKVLRQEKVGVFDNFFELGGDSILSIRMAAQAQKEGLALSTREVFQHQTIAELAALVKETEFSQEPSMEVISRKDFLRPSFAQNRLWFLAQMDKESSAYNIPMAVRIKGLLCEETLSQSLRQVIKRHESLRLSFGEKEGQAYVKIEETIDLPLVIHDFSTLASEEQKNKVKELSQIEATKVFDLNHTPLFRMTLLHINEQEHIFLLTMHHIISDAWSIEIFLEDLTTLYQSYREKQEPILEALPVQYLDYAHWQHNWLQGSVLEKQVNYWKKELAGVSPLAFPHDFPRRSLENYSGKRESLFLPPEVVALLKKIAQEEETTPFTVLLALFQELLHRYSGQDDIAVGSPVANRERIEVQKLIGFFVNVIVLRTRVCERWSFREFLQAVREKVQSAFTHQDLPFEKIVQELQPKRDLSRTPIFQVMFNWLNVSGQKIDIAGLEMESLDTYTPPSKFDLTLYAHEKNEGIQCHLVYNSSLFGASTIKNFLEHLKILAGEVAQKPDEELAQISLASSKVDLAISLPEPFYLPVTRSFHEVAQKTPDKIALSQSNQTWTYARLAQASSAFTQKLLCEGLQEEDVVAVVAEYRCFPLVAAVIGVLESRGILLTIDSQIPLLRQKMMLGEAKAKYVLTIGKVEESPWEDMSVKVIAVPEAGFEEDVSQEIALPLVQPNDQAYIFFTSGTTGVPKGILGCQKGLGHFLAWQRETFAISSTDRGAFLTGLSFDMVLRDIFLPLTSGGTLCLPSLQAQQNLNFSELLSWLEEAKISFLHLVPAVAQSWLSHLPENINLASLRWIFFAGEPLLSSLVEKWRSSFPQSGSIVNFYGATETTLIKSFYFVPPKPSSGIQPAGKPLPQTQTLVLNSAQKLCAPGEVGEIIIRTPYRTLGYINAPEEAKKRFCPNPHNSDPQDIFYHTGDLGRYDLEGNLLILGRKDDQVKIHGVRIELGEIDALWNQHPQIDTSLTLAREDLGNEKRLVSYLVPKKQTELDLTELRQFLQKQVPLSMVPAHLVILNNLPLNPSGKVDRSALPKPSEEGQREKSYEAPRNQTEKELIHIWQEILSVKEVGIHDNFFELGGHSLNVAQVIAHIQSCFGQELPLRSVFESPTIAELALLLVQQDAQDLEEDDLSAMLAELEGLSDDDVDKLLGD